MLDAATRQHATRLQRFVRFAARGALLCGVSFSAQAQSTTKPAAPTATPASSVKPTATPVATRPPAAAADAAARPRHAAATSATTPADVHENNEPTINAAAAHVDELAALREQLSVTTDESERARLERQLLEKLANATDDKAAALDELRLMLHENRYDPAFYYNLGNALARLGDSSVAIDAYRKAISQKHGHYARALNNLGVILLRQGRWDEAYDALAAALTEEHNTYAEASYNLGRLYLLRGDADLAIREWQHTLALQPDHADAAAALARAYAEDGNVRRGLEVLDAFSARNTRTTGSTPLAIVSARREITNGADVANDDARVNGGSAYTMRPDANHANAGRSSINDNRAIGNRGARSSSGLRVLSVDPQTYDVLQRARSAREAGRGEEAIKYYRTVLARAGGYFPPANLELALTLVNLKRSDEAMATLETLVRRDGARYPVAYYHLARLYEHANEIDRAADSFQRAAELYGDSNPQVLLDLSRVREKQGDNEGALAALESYVKAMAAEGATPAWADEKLAQLRAKAAPAKP